MGRRSAKGGHPLSHLSRQCIAGKGYPVDRVAAGGGTAHTKNRTRRISHRVEKKGNPMKHKLMSFALALAVTLAAAFPLPAAAQGSVTVKLTGQKVARDANGKEKLESAETAKPGDIIEYQAVYRNKGKIAADDVLATIPVPLGTEYIPGSAKPAKVTASVDGKEYAPVPLKRKVTLPSGQTEMRPVPYEEYHSIRWKLKTLEPGKSATFSIRVKLST